jgi:hypothetical protein
MLYDCDEEVEASSGGEWISEDVSIGNNIAVRAFSIDELRFQFNVFNVFTTYTLSWMMDKFIHWPKPYLLWSATCDEILSWMIEIWMKNHLVSDSNWNTVNL